jgi:hypothetical protein
MREALLALARKAPLFFNDLRELEQAKAPSIMTSQMFYIRSSLRGLRSIFTAYYAENDLALR